MSLCEHIVRISCGESGPPQHGHEPALLISDASLQAGAVLICYPYSGGSPPFNRYIRTFLITFHMQAPGPAKTNR